MNPKDSSVEILHHHSLKNANTFGLDVSAALFAEPENVEELRELAEHADLHQGPCLVLGEGSNILFRKDFPGMVLRPCMKGIELVEIRDASVWVKVGAAEHWDDWVRFATEQGWYGLENLSLIPGSVGSAPVQNIGAYGTELKDHFAWLEAWDLQEGKTVRLEKEDCRFGYRTSIFKTEQPGRYVITRVCFRLSLEPELNLSYGNIGEVFRRSGGTTPVDLREVVISVRRKKLPDPHLYANAGSFFKNPLVDRTVFKCIRAEFREVPHYREANKQVKIPAAWLIEKSGWKGKRSGNVGTWPDQPLVIVNYGGATGEEILAFSERIREDVDRKLGVTLEREVQII
jgi:UDP-N-acetylmuramate dehydrogenase